MSMYLLCVTYGALALCQSTVHLQLGSQTEITVGTVSFFFILAVVPPNTVIIWKQMCF